MDETRQTPVLRLFRIRLRTFALAIAALALVFALVVPLAKQVFFPSQWNTWIVKTAKEPDGSVVRVRIRRYPQRDVVHKEVLRRKETDSTTAAHATSHPAPVAADSQ